MPKELLFDTDDPNVKLGFRTKDGYLQNIQVTKSASSIVIDGNTETRTFTETTVIIQSQNGNS